MDSEARGVLAGAFGARGLAYFVAVDEAAADAFLADGEPLPEAAQQAVHAELMPRALAAKEEFAVPPHYPRAYLLRYLAEFDESAGVSNGNRMRQACGGVLPQLKSTTDDLLRAIQEFALDVYVLLLIPHLPMMPALPPGPTFDHPARARIQHASISDASFQKLFPVEASDAGTVGITV